MENIEQIKHNLSDYDYYFLKNLQQYIDAELIFFGSIRRIDFFKGKSDIDIAIITDNVESVIRKLQNYFNIGRSKIKRSIQKHNGSVNLIYGYKINFDDFENNLYLEIIVYDDKYKKYINNIIERSNNLPFYITLIIYILKIFAYQFEILPEDVFKYIKNLIIKNYFKEQLDKNLMTIKI
jgi:nitrogen regulatory protein PII